MASAALLEVGGIDGLRRLGEVHVAHLVDGHDVQVDVRHLEPDDHHRDARRVERRLLRSPDELRHDHQVLRDRRVEVEPVVGLDPRARPACGRCCSGLIDMNPTHRSSRHTNVPGISPSMMREKSVGMVRSSSRR